MTAALLVDWENVRIALNSQGYHCYRSREIAEGLIANARTRVQEHQLTLSDIHAFMPHTEDTQELIDAGLAPTLVATGPQSADMALSARALRLAIQGCQEVIIVANDAGFAATAKELQSMGTNCRLWPVNARSTRAEVRDWHLTEYLEDVLELRRCPPPPTDTFTLLVLGCMRLAHDGRALWGYQQAVKELAHLEFLGSEGDVTRNWSVADTRGYFSTDQAIVDGQPRPRRRLAFEQRAVWRPLTICDSALAAIGGRRDQAPRDDVLAALQHPLLDNPSEQIALFDLLRESRFIAGQDLYRLPVDHWRFGTVSAVRRLILVAWAACADEEMRVGGRVERLSKTKIAQRWPPQVMPQRRIQGRQFDLLRQQGNGFVRLAEVAGALVRHTQEVPGQKPLITYQIRDEHSIVSRMRTSVLAVLNLLHERGAGQQRIHQDEVLEAMRHAARSGGTQFGWTDAEHRQLLGMLAAAEIAPWSQQHIGIAPLAEHLWRHLDPGHVSS